MENLTTLVEKIDDFFEVKKLAADPSMSKFLEPSYQAINFDWQNFFEPEFVQRANGLMIKGADEVNTIFTGVFPTPEVMENFIASATSGDLLFLHHPLDMECGDPQGSLGRGFLPISAEHLKQVKEKKLSIYSCHAPMDTNLVLGTNSAIIEALDAKVVEQFLPYANGYAGFICEIASINTDSLVEKLKNIFQIPYVDFSGVSHPEITRLAIVAGGGDDAEYFQEVEEKGCQAYLSGQIHNRIDNDYGRAKIVESQEYAKTTQMSLIGVSHAASEFLVMKTQLPKWLEENFSLKVLPITMEKWWR